MPFYKLSNNIHFISCLFHFGHEVNILYVFFNGFDIRNYFTLITYEFINAFKNKVLLQYLNILLIMLLKSFHHQALLNIIIKIT